MAPGNKTIQIFEIIEEKARMKSTFSTGVIITNELNPKRVGNMSHFLKLIFL